MEYLTGTSIAEDAAPVVALTSVGERLGEKIRERRRAIVDEKTGRRMTQVDLARIIGTDPGYIARIETGVIKKPGLVSIAKIARALHTNVDELLGDSEPSEIIGTVSATEKASVYDAIMKITKLTREERLEVRRWIEELLKES